MNRIFGGAIFAMIVFTGTAYAFDLSSPNVIEGQTLNQAQVYKGFGCNGGNLSPALIWKDSPAGVRSYAVTVFDPDAPTGSGWWHWLVYDLPASMTSLQTGLAVKAILPASAKQGRNDFGSRNFGGACPPAGDKPHRYVFTLYALKVENLGVPDDASAALIGFMLNSNSLGKAQLTATFYR
jgi:Raf kinase inhibitor-like YbhB/YbcL family protein